MREKYIQDTRIHCCLFFINPTGHSLKPVSTRALTLSSLRLLKRSAGCHGDARVWYARVGVSWQEGSRRAEGRKGVRAEGRWAERANSS